MIVLCLEGVHGSGKTYILHKCKQAGFKVLDEGFMPIPTPPAAAPSSAAPSSSPNRKTPVKSVASSLPQSLVMETLWVARWFERLLTLQASLQQEGSHAQQRCIYIADRSPFSAVFYAQEQKGHLLTSLISQMITDLRTNANIFIYTMLVQVSKEKIWSRICSRLKDEPHRKLFNEHKRAWLDHVYNLYEEFGAWDYIVSNEEDDDQHVLYRIMSDVSRKVPEMSDHLSSLVPYSSSASPSRPGAKKALFL